MHWATMGGATVLGLPSVGRIAPGMAADIAVIGLDHPRHMGLHDPALAPVITGAAPVRHLLVAGREVVRDGALPGLDLSDLAEAARGAVAAMTFRQKQGASARLPAHA
jgi:cytosine/adenosine deaminase-related metal-dependent hydrolase